MGEYDSVYDSGSAGQSDFLSGFWDRLGAGNSQASGRGGFEQEPPASQSRNAPQMDARRNALVSAPQSYGNYNPVGGGPEDGPARWEQIQRPPSAQISTPVSPGAPPGTMGTQTEGPMLRPAPVNALAPQPEQASLPPQYPIPPNMLPQGPFQSRTPLLGSPSDTANNISSSLRRPVEGLIPSVQEPVAQDLAQRARQNQEALTQNPSQASQDTLTAQDRLAKLPAQHQDMINAPVAPAEAARDATPQEASTLGKIGTSQWPAPMKSDHPGVIVAGTDQAQRVANVKGYGQQLTGTVTVNGNTYRFINGGGGRGSIPFGEYKVGNFRTAETRERAGMSKLGDTFDLSNVYDPMARDTRSALRIHQARGGGTAGCIGLVGGQDTWKRFVRDMQVSKPNMLRFGPVGVASNQSE